MEHFYQKKIAQQLQPWLTCTEQEIIALLERPPKKEMGDFSFPCFTLSKVLKKAPQKIAEEIALQIHETPLFSEVKAVGPYINFFLNQINFITESLKKILHLNEKKFTSVGAGKTIVIDYSSPNIAKPFSIAHLRSTSIGNSLAHIFEYLGYKVVRINHLGDWGTSFGKLIVAYQRWGNNDDLMPNPIKKLLELFIRFHKEAKENPHLEDEARSWFKKLEDQHSEAVRLWKWFKDLSLKEFKRMYDLLGVQFDHYWGESFYQDKIPPLLKEIEKQNLSSESEGAIIINLDKYDMPPVLLKKQDGATLYATRDMAAAIYREQQFDFHQMIYVVGGEQALHFNQFFKALELMNYKWFKDCHHVGFGLIQFQEGKMSTREGRIIFLEDVIEQAKKLALKKINETEAEKPVDKRLTDDERNERALKIAVSSVIFYDLKNGRMKDVLFDWDEMLNPKGETGIYLQYAHARLCGILRKFEQRIGEIDQSEFNITETASFDIVKALSMFRERVIHAAKMYEPSVIARYLLDLAQLFSSYYRANQVINEDNQQLSQERVKTVLAVKSILADGLRLLGIEPLEKM